jgi:hypothetical protein
MLCLSATGMIVGGKEFAAKKPETSMFLKKESGVVILKIHVQE